MKTAWERRFRAWAARGGSAAVGLGAIGRACTPIVEGGEEVSDESRTGYWVIISECGVSRNVHATLPEAKAELSNCKAMG
jgi:hypothetical protein